VTFSEINSNNSDNNNYIEELKRKYKKKPTKTFVVNKGFYIF